mmetsp:Transcript_22563/g.56010  ORF Transcript_22563/g.56010 Transcript_22563/m.56010 type:complete len:237 (+) Transcript_22563:778-1488(+)
MCGFDSSDRTDCHRQIVLRESDAEWWPQAVLHVTITVTTFISRRDPPAAGHDPANSQASPSNLPPSRRPVSPRPRLHVRLIRPLRLPRAHLPGRRPRAPRPARAPGPPPLRDRPAPRAPRDLAEGEAHNYTGGRIRYPRVPPLLQGRVWRGDFPVAQRSSVRQRREDARELRQRNPPRHHRQDGDRHRREPHAHQAGRQEGRAPPLQIRALPHQLRRPPPDLRGPRRRAPRYRLRR